MKKFIIPLAAVLAISFSGTDTFAKGRDRGRGPGPGEECRHEGMFFGNPEALKKSLGLSDEQVDRIGKINLDYRKKFLKIREQSAPKNIRLQTMLLEDSVDLDKVKALLNEISDLQVEMRMLRITQRLEIEKVLTPDQRVKLKNSPAGQRKGMRPHPPRGDDPDMDM